MYQNLTVVGFIGRDAEVRAYKNYNIIEFTLANTERHGDKEFTTWYKCAIWRKQESSIDYVKYLHKGAKVLVTGKPGMDIYVNKQNEAAGNLTINVDQFDILHYASDSEFNTSAPKSNDSRADLPLYKLNNAKPSDNDDLPF